MLTLRNW